MRTVSLSKCVQRQSSSSVLVCISTDIHRDIEEDIRQLEKVMDYTKGNGLIIAADTNARSKMWHDTITSAGKS